MTAFLRRASILAKEDLTQQFANPLDSMLGNFLTKVCSSRTAHLEEAALNELRLGVDDNVLEIGYGRGHGLAKALEKLHDGKGIVFGVERSAYMEKLAKKRFILEVEETRRLRLDSVHDPRHLPYPNDFFAGAFHVDVFYFVKPMYMAEVVREWLRVIRPSGQLVAAMQISLLEKFQKWHLIEEIYWRPVPYLRALEMAGCVDVGMTYEEHPSHGTFQILRARKPEASETFNDPEARWKELELKIKEEMLARQLIKQGRPMSYEEIVEFEKEVKR